MFEVIVQLLGEFLLQLAAEGLFGQLLHSITAPFRRLPKAWFTAAAYALCGVLFGGLSLLVFAANLVPQSWRIFNLIATPIAVGGVMVLIGAWRRRRGQPLLQIDRFAYGYLFALALGLVRFLFAV